MKDKNKPHTNEQKQKNLKGTQTPITKQLDGTKQTESNQSDEYYTSLPLPQKTNISPHPHRQNVSLPHPYPRKSTSHLTPQSIKNYTLHNYLQ